MKGRKSVIIFSLFIIFSASEAYANQIYYSIPEWVKLYRAEEVNVDKTIKESVSIVDDGDHVILTLRNIELTRWGQGDTKGKGLFPAEELTISSGLLDNRGGSAFYEASINNNEIAIRFPNVAKIRGEAQVEHFWGDGEGERGWGHLVLYTSDPWVSYESYKSGEPNLNTLVIGIVMYPDKPTVSLKSLEKGKLGRGSLKHELRNYWSKNLPE